MVCFMGRIIIGQPEQHDPCTRCANGAACLACSGLDRDTIDVLGFGVQEQRSTTHGDDMVSVTVLARIAQLSRELNDLTFDLTSSVNWSVWYSIQDTALIALSIEFLTGILT